MADSELLLGQKSLGLLWEKLREVQVPVQPARNGMEPMLTGDCMSRMGLDRALEAETATAGSAEALTATAADLAEAVTATAESEAVSATADTEAVPATADLAEVGSWVVLHLEKVQ